MKSGDKVRFLHAHTFGVPADGGEPRLYVTPSDLVVTVANSGHGHVAVAIHNDVVLFPAGDLAPVSPEFEFRIDATNGCTIVVPKGTAVRYE